MNKNEYKQDVEPILWATRIPRYIEEELFNYGKKLYEEGKIKTNNRYELTRFAILTLLKIMKQKYPEVASN